MYRDNENLGRIKLIQRLGIFFIVNKKVEKGYFSGSQRIWRIIQGFVGNYKVFFCYNVIECKFFFKFLDVTLEKKRLEGVKKFERLDIYFKEVDLFCFLLYVE